MCWDSHGFATRALQAVPYLSLDKHQQERAAQADNVTLNTLHLPGTHGLPGHTTECVSFPEASLDSCSSC